MPRETERRYTPPPFDPGDHRDVGKGADFGADLHALLKAGTESFPEYADMYRQVALTTHDLAQRLDFLADSVGGEPAFTPIKGLRSELQVFFTLSSRHLAEAGHSLVEIADDYARTDSEAADTYSRLANRGDGTTIPVLPPPPSSGSPYTTPYTPPSLDAPCPTVPEDEAPPLWPWDQREQAPVDPDRNPDREDGPGLDDERPLDEDVAPSPRPEEESDEPWWKQALDPEPNPDHVQPETFGPEDLDGLFGRGEEAGR